MLLDVLGLHQKSIFGDATKICGIIYGAVPSSQKFHQLCRIWLVFPKWEYSPPKSLEYTAISTGDNDIVICASGLSWGDE